MLFLDKCSIWDLPLDCGKSLLLSDCDPSEFLEFRQVSGGS